MTQEEYDVVCKIISRQLKLITLTPTYKKMVIDTVGVEKIKMDISNLLDDSLVKDRFMNDVMQENFKFIVCEDVYGRTK